MTIWTGRGGDTITIDGTHNRATATNPDGTPMRTVTTLNTGAGNDTVNVSLNTADGFFVLNTQAGDDTVDADGRRRLPDVAAVIRVRRLGNDTINSGTGDDFLFGDLGRVHYNDGSTPVARLGGGGPGDITDGVVRDPSQLFNAIAGLRSLNAGNDGMQRDGETVAIRADDRHRRQLRPRHHSRRRQRLLAGHHRELRRRPGDDIVLGDYGQVTWAPTGAADGCDRSLDTTDTQFGGEDRIEGGTEDDVLIGGSNGDQIDGDAGRDLIFGDNVSLSLVARVGNFTDLRFQGLAASGTLYTTAAGGVVLVPNLAKDGNGNFIPRVNPVGTPSWNDFAITLLDHDDAIQNTPLNRFGNDYIAGGAGDDTIFGELGNDTIQGDGDIESGVAAAPSLNCADGTNLGTRVGACRTANPGGLGATDNQLLLNPSFESTTDGSDYIEGGGGNDVVFGGLGQDDIIGGNSSLYGLVNPNQRPDGSDLLFGGAGVDVARNYTDTVDTTHGRDADVIAADNANVYRLVATLPATSFLSYAYDNAYGEQLVVRGVMFLDYVVGGPDYTSNTYDVAGGTLPCRNTGVGVTGSAADGTEKFDRGGNDEIHGEGGDDQIYGMCGNDVIYGDGQDDVIVGGWGNDWISGGTGDDGVLGDDGRLFVSRNQLAEPLFGIAATPAQSEITTPGRVQIALINETNRLKYTADMTPFNLDPSGNVDQSIFRPRLADDIIFGGLGDDSMHGGSGDDAMSGAEALSESYISYDGLNFALAVRSDFNRPFNPGYGSATTSRTASTSMRHVEPTSSRCTTSSRRWRRSCWPGARSSSSTSSATKAS